MWVMLAACSGTGTTEPPDATPGVTDPGTTTSWTVPDATDPPAFDAAALSDGLDAVLAQVLSLDSTVAMDVYDSAMGYGSGGCPSVVGYPYGYGWLDAWYSQCESAAGAVYSGYSSDYTEGTSRGLYMSATILTPDGHTLTGAGYFSRYVGFYGSDRYEYQYFDGIIEYDGPEAAGTWIEDGVQPHELSINRGEAGDGSWHSVSVNGAYTGGTGFVDTVDFDYASLSSWYNCDEPSGAIAIRTVDGDWYDLSFADGGDSCDGCGTASWRGLEMGQVCGDFGVWSQR